MLVHAPEWKVHSDVPQRRLARQRPALKQRRKSVLETQRRAGAPVLDSGPGPARNGPEQPGTASHRLM